MSARLSPLPSAQEQPGTFPFDHLSQPAAGSKLRLLAAAHEREEVVKPFGEGMASFVRLLFLLQVNSLDISSCLPFSVFSSSTFS